MGFLDFRVVVPAEAFGFYGQHVGDFSIAVAAKRQSVVPAAAGAELFGGVRIVELALADAVVDLLEMLKLVVVEAKEKGRHVPVGMAGGTPMLNGEPRDRLAKVSLEGYAVEGSGIVGGGVEGLGR